MYVALNNIYLLCLASLSQHDHSKTSIDIQIDPGCFQFLLWQCDEWLYYSQKILFWRHIFYSSYVNTKAYNCWVTGEAHTEMHWKLPIKKKSFWFFFLTRPQESQYFTPSQILTVACLFSFSCPSRCLVICFLLSSMRTHTERDRVLPFEFTTVMYTFLRFTKCASTI